MIGTREWTIDELTAQAALALSEARLDQPSGRITDVPTLRTIRYYVTCGLLAPASRYRGRIALYGERHLVQLVAIKRLQARGLSLVEVQERLAGIDERRLAELAALPVAASHPRRPERRFWTEPPVDAGSRSAPLAATPSVAALHLAPQVLLVLERAARALDAEDEEAIRAAAAPLIKLLAARRLLASSPTSGGE